MWKVYITLDLRIPVLEREMKPDFSLDYTQPLCSTFREIVDGQRSPVSVTSALRGVEHCVIESFNPSASGAALAFAIIETGKASPVQAAQAKDGIPSIELIEEQARERW